MANYALSQTSGYFLSNDCKVSDLEAYTGQTLDVSDLTFATDVQKNIPIYDMNELRDRLRMPSARRALMAEWAYVFSDSAGVIVLKNAYEDTTCIDEASEIFQQIIKDEKQMNGEGADHFATAGNNDRIWNSLQKLCERSPSVFAKYFANPAIDTACEAWLGPNYQMTAQVNLVRPGGKAQTCHRDYHLGFQTEEMCARYPVQVHLLSPLMTLQGGIAHCDMAIESGPTKLLPFSQKYAAGYAAYRRADFQQHFEDNYVQLPLDKGDALFFNPALYHAAGENTSEGIERLVNLMQIGSAMGRTLENIDRIGMSKLLYPALKELTASENLSPAEINAAVSVCAEGYPFPTNLDTDPPVGGLAPESQKDIFLKALGEKWSDVNFVRALDAQAEKQKA
ncbi:MAG: phytanoyl-CoA dioxygenase family protein [Lentilitoribacter sp.]